MSEQSHVEKKEENSMLLHKTNKKGSTQGTTAEVVLICDRKKEDHHVRKENGPVLVFSGTTATFAKTTAELSLLPVPVPRTKATKAADEKAQRSSETSDEKIGPGSRV